LFDIDEAVRRNTIMQLLVSDAAQREIWPVVKANLQPGAALCFPWVSIAYSKQTGDSSEKRGCYPGSPKGSISSVRRNFLYGAALLQLRYWAGRRSGQRALSYTHPESSVPDISFRPLSNARSSALTGERGVLMGAAGSWSSI
jgi:ketol-acid reductoisomerase